VERGAIGADRDQLGLPVLPERHREPSQVEKVQRSFSQVHHDASTSQRLPLARQTLAQPSPKLGAEARSEVKDRVRVFPGEHVGFP
jgi:hypothetical protein